MDINFFDGFGHASGVDEICPDNQGIALRRRARTVASPLAGPSQLVPIHLISLGGSPQIVEQLRPDGQVCLGDNVLGNFAKISVVPKDWKHVLLPIFHGIKYLVQPWLQTFRRSVTLFEFVILDFRDVREAHHDSLA